MHLSEILMRLFEIFSSNEEISFFFQMFANYDELEIGALECEEIEGEIDTDSQLFKIAAEEFEKDRQMVKHLNKI